MKKIFLLLFSLSIFAYAAPTTTYDYYIVLGNIDHVKILDKVFDAIGFFFNRDSGNVGTHYYNLLWMIALVGVLFATTRMAVSAMSGNATIGIKQYVIYLLSMVFVLTIIYGPRSTILIQTKDSSWYAEQEKIPQLFAFTISFFTKLRSELSELSEEAFNIPDPTDNFETGGSNGLGYVGMETQLVEAALTANLNKPGVDSELQPMYSRFLRDCVILPYISIGNSTAVRNLQESKQITTDISPGVTKFSDEFIEWNGQTDRCSKFWDGTYSSVGNPDGNLSTFPPSFIPLKTKIDAFQRGIGYKEDGVTIDPDATNAGRNYAKLASSIAYAGALMNSASAISDAASIKAATTQAVLSNEFKSTFAAMGVAGQVMSDGAAQASADTQMSGFSTGLYMSKMLPMFSFLVFALMIASAPFMFAFALLPGSLNVMLNFLKTLMWVSLWDPMANILGLFMDFYFAQNLKSKGYDTVTEVLSMTPDNLIDVSSEAAMIAGIAGGMYVAVQGLSWMLVTGSGQMLGNLMSGMASSFQNRANAEAQMATRGDMMEAQLMSKELGHAVSMREKYSYGAMTQASTNAGAMAGHMKAYGGGDSDISTAAATMQLATHTGATASAMSHGASIGQTKEIGSGATSAAQLGYMQGSATGGGILGTAQGQGSASNAAEVSRKSARLAAESASVDMNKMDASDDLDIREAALAAGKKAATTRKSEVEAAKKEARDQNKKTHKTSSMGTNSHDKKQVTWDESLESTVDKAVQQQTLTQMKTMGGMSHKDIDEVSTFDATTTVAQNKTKVATAKKAAEDHGHSGQWVSEVKSTVEKATAQQQRTQMETMNNLSADQIEQGAEIAGREASGAVKGKIKAAKQTFGGTSDKQLDEYEDSIEEATSQDSSTQLRRGKNLGKINQKKKNTMAQMKADMLEKTDAAKLDAFAKETGSSFQGAANTAVANAATAGAQQLASQDADIKAQGGSAAAVSNATQMGRAAGHKTDAEADIYRGKTDAQMNAQANYAAQKTVGAAFKEQQTFDSVNKQTGAKQDISDIGVASALQNFGTLGRVEEATNHKGGINNSAHAMFMQGGMQMAETDAMMNTLEATGNSAHGMGTYVGTSSASKMSGQRSSSAVRGAAILSKMDPAVVQSVLSRAGLAGTSLANNPAAVAAAFEGFNTMVSHSADGRKTEFAVNAATGDVGYSSVSSASTYDAGSHNRTDLGDTAASIGMDFDASATHVLGRQAGKKVVSTVWDLSPWGRAFKAAKAAKK